MLRLFFSLYFFVALVLIGLAAILDDVFFDDAEVLSTSEQALVEVALSHLKHGYPLPTLEKEDTGITIKVIDWNTLQWPEAMQVALRGDETVVTGDDATATQFYRRIDDEQLLEMTLAASSEPKVNLWLYSLTFYLLLGMALIVWTLPLWKDLRTLSKSAQSLQPDGRMLPVHTGKLSMIGDIVTAFNRLTQQVQRLLAQQRETAGALAHELRTPLSRLQFALASKPTPDSESWLAMAQDVKALESLVQEMLDYSRMQGLSEELAYAEVPLKATLEEMLSRFEPGTNVRCEVRSTHELVVLADGHLLERALQNLIQNAIRHAASQVHVSFSELPERICIVVEDDGPGVAPADREKIFEPFFRPDQGRSRSQGGAGLGLAIVANIAEQHHGGCSVGSSELGGAKFIFRLPKQ